MQDTSISGEKQRAIEAAVVVAFAATGQRGTLALQMVQALPGLGVDDAWAEGGLDACDRRKERKAVQVGQSVSNMKSGFKR